MLKNRFGSLGIHVVDMICRGVPLWSPSTGRAQGHAPTTTIPREILKSHRFEWIIRIVVAALVGGAWIFVSKEEVKESSTLTLTEAPIVGHLAPDFTLQPPTGESYTLSDFRGQPVVLNFWASWCGPCRVEMPFFERTQMKYNGQTAVIGVNQGESADIVQDFGVRQNISYPLLVDDDNRVNLDYNVNSLPTTIFIDADGVVEEVIVGIVNQAVLEDRIERMMVKE